MKKKKVDKPEYFIIDDSETLAALASKKELAGTTKKQAEEARKRILENLKREE